VKRRALMFVLPWAMACAVGPRYAPPQPPLPGTFTEAPAAAAGSDSTLATWWTEFKDPTLDRLVASAVEGNLDLKIAAARIREARAAHGIAASAALPVVAVGATYERRQRSDALPPFNSIPEGNSPFGPREQSIFQAGFDAGWEIDVFGGVRRDKEAALAQVQAAEEGRRDVLVTLVADVARNYVELRTAQRQIDILDQTLKSEQETLQLADARYRAGLGTELDTARAKGQLEASAARRPTLEVACRQAIYRMGVLLGQPPESLVSELATAAPMAPTPPAVPAILPSELLSRRPDVRRAERELAAATAGIGVARADLFPRFTILGGVGWLSADAGDLGSGTSQFWSLLPGIHWPIFSGGRIRANIRVQSARQEQALGQYEKTVLAALESVEVALLQRSHELSRAESLNAAVEANRLALDLATERYTGGLESFLSVLDAQRAVYFAEDQLAQSDRDLALSVIAVHKALGGGWSVDPQSGQPVRAADR
jgi:outer membrane protein, multidrug efflux system